jgi:hypothetical protein
VASAKESSHPSQNGVKKYVLLFLWLQLGSLDEIDQDGVLRREEVQAKRQSMVTTASLMVDSVFSGTTGFHVLPNKGVKFKVV